MGHSYIAQAYKPNGTGLKYVIDFEQNKYFLRPGELEWSDEDNCYIGRAQRLMMGVFTVRMRQKYISSFL